MRSVTGQIVMYSRGLGKISAFEESIRKMNEALERERLKAEALQKSIRKAEQKIQGYVATHFVIDEAADFNSPPRTQINSMSSRKPRRNKDGGSDHEPYYVKLTSKKRR